MAARNCRNVEDTLTVTVIPSSSIAADKKLRSIFRYFYGKLIKECEYRLNLGGRPQTTTTVTLTNNVSSIECNQMKFDSKIELNFVTCSRVLRSLSSTRRKSKLTAPFQQGVVAPVKLATGQESLAGSGSCGWNSRGQRVMGRCRRIPRWRPARCLPVEHSQLVVDTLGALMRLHRGSLLLLLRGQVSEHPVNGRHLRGGWNFY